MIKSIKLINWQKHANLVLNFEQDINIITGFSNSGKSSIRRAIEWVCVNANISENDYRKEGTSETSVTIILDTKFEIERIRSKTLNRYILRHPETKEEIFDSFGRDIPEPIKKVLNLSLIEIDNESINLNIAEQLTLPFLLDKPASFRAKLFNKLTGNELLDILFKECNKESLHINRDIKDTEQNIKDQEDNLAEYSKTYTNLKKKLNSAKQQFQTIQENIKIYETLQSLAESLQINNENKNNIKEKIKQIKLCSDKIIADLKKKAEELNKLQDLFSNLESCKFNLKKVEKLQKEIKVPKINIEELKQKNEKLKMLQQLDKSIQELIQGYTKNKQQQTGSLAEIKTQETKLKMLWQECKVCPLCKQQIGDK